MRRPTDSHVIQIIGRSLILVVFMASVCLAWTGRDVQDRIDHDIAEGDPVVVHVVVALCDNANQGIVPVPDQLGSGQDPRSNLYWGAAYGVGTFLSRTSAWTRVETITPEDPRILERIVLLAHFPRNGVEVPVIIVADAWDGAHIQEAMDSYLEMAAGHFPETVSFSHESDQQSIIAGGAAHLVAYVGHNGLMEFSLESPVSSPERDQPRDAIALACMSHSYFQDHLESAGAHSLLLTTGLMAPEAYTLDAAIRAWVTEGTTAAVVEAAASAYNKYQHCGMRGARRLFWGEDP